MKNFKDFTESTNTLLTISFKSDTHMTERIYELDMKLNFRKLFNAMTTKQKSPNANFDFIFKGDKRQLEEVLEYIINKLDKKNKHYITHKWK